MTLRTRHLTGSAKPGEPNDRPKAPAPPPPPRWRMWLLPAGILITLLLLSLPHTSSTPTKNFSYSKFLSQVDSGHVRTASVNPERRHHRHPQGRRRLHQPDPHRHHRQPAGPHPEGPRRGRHRGGTGLGPPHRPVVVPPLPVVHRLLHLDRTEELQAAGRGDHGHRGVQGQGLRRGQAHHPVRRHRRLRGGQAGGVRGGRLPEPPRALRPGRGHRPPGGAHGGPAGDGQDPDGPGRRGRGRAFPSWPSPARASSSCSWGSGPPGSGTCSPTPASGRPRSSSSTRSTPSASAGGAPSCPTTSGSRPSTSCWPRWTASTPRPGWW